MLNKKTELIKSLTGIKALAMLALFWWHTSIPNPPIDLGARACEILFVVSGFLIGYNNFNKDIPATWKESIRYVAIRFVKFWPLHFLTMVITLVKCVRPVFTYSNLITAFLNLTLLQAWSPYQDVYRSFNKGSWFLSSLFFCYFMSPLLLKFAKKIRVSVVMFILCFLAQFFLEFINKYYANQFWSINIHISPLIRCLEFFLGMLMVPLFIHLRKILSAKHGLVFFSLFEFITTALVLFFLYAKEGIWLRASFSLLFCVMIFVFSFDSGILSKFLSIKPFKWFASIQFEFYLLYMTIWRCIGDFYNRVMPNWIIINTVFFVTTIVIAWLYKRFLSERLSGYVQNALNKVFMYLNFNLKI